jgi:hypothetical protein
MDTGLRVSEMLNLRENDIDFHNLLMKVFGKGQKERIVPFSPEVRKRLYRLSQLNGIRADFVFAGFGDVRWEKRNATTSLHLLLAKLGLPQFGWHRFRHTFATNYLRHGGDIVRLSMVLGHTQITTTQRYLHLLTDQPSASESLAGWADDKSERGSEKGEAEDDAGDGALSYHSPMLELALSLVDRLIQLFQERTRISDKKFAVIKELYETLEQVHGDYINAFNAYKKHVASGAQLNEIITDFNDRRIAFEPVRERVMALATTIKKDESFKESHAFLKSVEEYFWAVNGILSGSPFTVLIRAMHELQAGKSVDGTISSFADRLVTNLRNSWRIVSRNYAELLAKNASQ